MKINCVLRVGKNCYSVITEWDNVLNWADYAFKKWGYWGLENSETSIIEGVPVGDWQYIDNWDELFEGKKHGGKEIEPRRQA